EAFTEMYRDATGARHVAELLLLGADVPRSLRACTEEIEQILASLPGSNGRQAQRLGAEMDARLRYTGINEILDGGLHAWLTEFIPLVRELGNAIHSSYLEVI
uniref:alpha-E domain-containing protein n=1 Tax=Vibrio vulnificus TaxID=672 RepID=UPI0039B44DD3